MNRPGVLIGILALILLLCAGAIVADQLGVFGAQGSHSSAPFAPSQSSQSGSSDPYGGIK